MEKMRLVAGMATMLAFLAVAGIGRAQDGSEAQKGAKVFKRVCAACHASEAGKNKIGPSLFGVVGRRSGSVPGFTYSKAMKTADITWDDETIDKYIANPKKVVPGNKMAYVGAKKEAERKEIIAYLETLH
jgi:cytochrome c